MVRTRMAVRRRARSPSRLSWAALTVVPWCLGAGLLMSMAADAGQDPGIGHTRLDLTDLAPAMPGDLVPLSLATEGRSFALPRGDALADGIRGAAGERPSADGDPD